MGLHPVIGFQVVVHHSIFVLSAMIIPHHIPNASLSQLLL